MKNEEILAKLFARVQDFELANHGSISLLTAKSTAAKERLRANIAIGEETQFWGAALVVEARYAEAIAGGILSAGLEHHVPEIPNAALTGETDELSTRPSSSPLPRQRR